MLKLFIVLSTFVILACAKECKPGQDCGLKCCTIPKGDVFCRARCPGLSCKRDVDCDGDCCVKSTCSSCLFKRLSIAPTAILETTESNIAAEVEPKKGETMKCSRFNNYCVSRCCIDGKCVDRSQCTPRKATRKGGRGGRRYRGGGGGSYSSSGDSGGGWPVWAWLLLAGGVVMIIIIIFIYKKFCR